MVTHLILLLELTQKLIDYCASNLIFCAQMTFASFSLHIHLHSEALQTSLLFSKDFGLLSFLRKSLGSQGSDEVLITIIDHR